jgi:hydroxypyruvate isomerase
MARSFDGGRRQVIRSVAALAVAGAAPSAAQEAVPSARGRLKQSISRWCLGKMSLDEVCQAAVRIGYKGLDLLPPQEWGTVKKHGLVCAMGSLGGPLNIEKGLNRVENHAAILAALRQGIDLASEAGVPNLVCFSGNRAGMSDEEGLENCAKGLAQVAGQAEKKGVTLCMELLNSKVDHKDYMCDHTAWGAALVARVGSPRVKLLYDIYHMQIMEGDVIRTLRANIAAIAHFHTAGNPGRKDLDDEQELNYAAICRAIVATGFQGFLAQEFVAKGDPVKAMEHAFRVCDV